VLVVVRAVAGVPMLGVAVVEVGAVRDRLVAAARAVDVHVPRMWGVDADRAVVDVVRVRVVHVPVMDEVEVSLVDDGGVSAGHVVHVPVMRVIPGRRVVRSGRRRRDLVSLVHPRTRYTRRRPDAVAAGATCLQR
jgi:hypothetical protein